jgi:hypothetical protein
LHDAALGEAAGLDDHREDAGGRHGEDEGRDEHFDEGEGASACATVRRGGLSGGEKGI